MPKIPLPPMPDEEFSLKMIDMIQRIVQQSPFTGYLSHEGVLYHFINNMLVDHNPRRVVQNEKRPPAQS